MITATTDFKTATEQPTKQWHAYLVDNGSTYPDEITDEDDLKTIRMVGESSILRTVMRRAEATFFGAHSYLDLEVNLGLGIVLPDTSTEYLDYGKFTVISSEYSDETGETLIKMFDKMYESTINYDLDPIYDITFPATIGDLLDAICTRLGWTLATGSDTFPNNTFSMSTDVISDNGLTFRDVLDDIAEASGSIIYFDVDDNLTVKQISHNTPLETLDPDSLKTFKIESKFGDINSVVLSRQPQEDNILDKDQTSIDANGLTEIKISNNVLVDADRETAVTPILTELLGLEFYPFEAETIGKGYFQIGDRIRLEDTSASTFETVISYIDLDISGGVIEELRCVTPDKVSTNYNTAGIIGQLIRNTQIIVNKQDGTITLLNSQVDSIEELTTILEQSITNIQITAQNIGGNNLLVNSTGLKGSLEEWQTVDSDGDPLDSRNNATITTSTDVQQNTESGSAFLIANQFINQTFSTIIDQEYTFYCRFKRTGSATLSINGIEYDLTTEGYSGGDWATFKQAFVAGSATTIMRVENTSTNTCLIGDMNMQKGDANGWVQAPNEVYGANFKFDKNGLEIRSLTDSIKMVIDNSRLYVTDTNLDKEIMSISKDEGVINNLRVQKLLTLQREDDTDKSLRMIPVSTGVLFIINN